MLTNLWRNLSAGFDSMTLNPKRARRTYLNRDETGVVSGPRRNTTEATLRVGEVVISASDVEGMIKTVKARHRVNNCKVFDAAYARCTCPPLCHCGQPVTYGYDDNPGHHRGMCEHCDTVRCDANPGACGR